MRLSKRLAKNFYRLDVGTRERFFNVLDLIEEANDALKAHALATNNIRGTRSKLFEVDAKIDHVGRGP